ncbi:ADP-heptose:LPS heptosyltransferase [Mucilaginibacter sp. OAE612]|uniref:glycosyltransferase family 9 protein n=1 Tax=Mucilaginibacter sp. OAE612 TaxID=3156444 RepID=UPI00359E0057
MMLLKRSTNKFLRILFRFFNETSLPFKSNRILIVRLDALGDYILFRNYVRCIKHAPKFKGYKLTLLGNIGFKDIAEAYDKDIIDEFIWITPSIIYDINEKIRLSFAFKKKAFDILINPVHSRVLHTDEFISQLGAKQKICSSGDYTNMESLEELKRSYKFYDSIIDVPGTDYFEYLRNRKFIETLTGQRIDTALNLPTKSKLIEKEALQLVIFPGAGQEYRRWGTNLFATAIDSIMANSTFKVTVTIAGSSADSCLATEIISQSKNKEKIEDKTGKTNLVELIELINNADLLISNDTSAIHIAAGTQTTAICISNGNHFGRFVPYPLTIANNIYTFYPSEEFNNKDNYALLNDLYKRGSNLNINNVDPIIISNKAISILNNAS